MSTKPLYVHRETIWFDELDMVGVMHNARYAIHVERAMTAWYHSLADVDPSDSLNVVKQYDIEFIQPFTVERGDLVVEVSLERRGRTSAVFSFRCLSYPKGEDGPEVLHARGIRAIVKVSPGDLRPAPWSEKFAALVGGSDV
ncbi:MAG TPA: hotdog domain-containing protein [Actinospica sp.]|jgi:acyl-CoA thioester hydrolase|nr:hotdog domain-containing protein [Actinospica sp.]